MAIHNNKEREQYNSYQNHKISGVEIEMNEKKFMNDEFEYYKELKTKPKKNYSYIESKKFKSL